MAVPADEADLSLVMAPRGLCMHGAPAAVSRC